MADYKLCGVGGSEDKGRFPKGLSCAEEDSQDPGGLAIVRIRWFSPLAKRETVGSSGGMLYAAYLKYLSRAAGYKEF